jgi:hypothetical protein
VRQALKRAGPSLRVHGSDDEKHSTPLSECRRICSVASEPFVPTRTLTDENSARPRSGTHTAVPTYRSRRPTSSTAMRMSISTARQ